MADAAASTLTAPFRLPDSPAESELVAKYFRGLGNPTRLRILELLMERTRSVGDLVDELALPQPKVSNHLACLRWCGFVTSRREFRTVYYEVSDARVTELVRLARSLLADNAEHVALCGTIDAKHS